MTRLTTLTLALGLGAATLIGCERSSQSNNTNSASTSSAAQATATEPLPATVILAQAPADPKDVAAARKEIKEGDEVIIRGIIGGSAKPITDGRAIFTIMDASVKSCAQMPGDHCPTPWDYCCEPKEVISANNAVVQVVGPDGKPLKADLTTVPGLKPLAEVTVKGKATKTGDTLLIDATGLFVKGS